MSKCANDSKKLRKDLVNAGFELKRTKGDHFIYKRGDETVSVPQKLNKMVGIRLRKMYLQGIKNSKINN